MKRVCTAVVLLFTSVAVHGQDLTGAWKRIETLFGASEHDSVVVLVRPFIAELERRNMPAQLSVAYYHYAVSMVHLGQYEPSDSLFSLALETARRAGDQDRLNEIASKRIQVYSLLAKGNEQRSPKESIRLYTKALEALGEKGDAQARGRLLYLRGALFSGTGEAGLAIRDLEQALLALGTSSEGSQIAGHIVPFLTQQYIQTGRLNDAETMVVRCASPAERVELTILLAGHREAAGDLAAADMLLGGIQHDVVQLLPEQRIVEFAKKRFTLMDARGLDAAPDTLRRMTGQIRQLGRTPGAAVQLMHLLALSCVQRGRVDEASAVVREMQSVGSSAAVGADQRLLIERTEADLSYLRGENDAAIEHYRTVKAQLHLLGTGQGIAVLNNLGLALTRTGRLDEALTVFDEALARARSESLQREAIQSDVNGGIVLLRGERNAEALERFTRARDSAQVSGQPDLLVMSSLHLAEAYQRSGQENLAAGLMDDIRAEQGKLSDPLSRIQVLLALAASNRSVAAGYQALEDLKTAYGLAQKVGARGYLGSLSQALADAYFVLDSLDTAERFYRNALEMYGQQADPRTVVELRFKLGQCLLSRRRYDEAREQIRGGLGRLELVAVKDPAAATKEHITDPDLYAQGLAHLAYVNSVQGAAAGQIRTVLEALREVQQSVVLMESHQLAQLSKAQRDAASVRNVNAYRLLVDIAVSLHQQTGDPRYFELAFNTSEKSRAEIFVAEIGSQLISKLNDPHARQLAAATNALSTEPSASMAIGSDLAQSSGMTRGYSVEQERAARALEHSRADYERLLRTLSSTDQKLTQLVSVNTLTLNSVRTLIHADELLLAYYVSLDRCYVFAVGPELQHIAVVHWRPEDMGAAVEGYRMALQDFRRSDHWVTGQILYDSLITPVKKWMKGKKIIVVPSGRLNTLPFGALSNNRTCLLEEYDITVIPNVSTLQFVRTPKKLSSRATVLAVGNPRNPQVSRLPGAEREVLAIRSVFEGASVLVGDAASETQVQQAMGSFDIVHVACHGLFNYQYPILSSLALSPDSENDGFLQVHELYNLNLLRTSLVVLSACETGLSQIKKNDDVIGFIRGFLYAGVPSTVASLWKVDDNATSALMSNFHLLLKLGNTKSQALRKAQIQLMRSKETAHPFFWAAFVLYGNSE